MYCISNNYHIKINCEYIEVWPILEKKAAKFFRSFSAAFVSIISFVTHNLTCCCWTLNAFLFLIILICARCTFLPKKMKLLHQPTINMSRRAYTHWHAIHFEWQCLCVEKRNDRDLFSNSNHLKLNRNSTEHTANY